MSDIIRHECDENLYATPLMYQQPNFAYLLSLGMLPCGRTVYGWGMTADWYQRRSQHRADHPGCQIVMLMDVGLSHPKPLEDEMRLHFRDKETRITKLNNKQVFECFVMREHDGYFSHFHDFMVNNFSKIIRSIYFEGVCTPVGTGGLHGTADADALLAIEREKTAQQREKTAQLQLNLQLMQLMHAPSTTPWK
jgi:hypothetical protein